MVTLSTLAPSVTESTNPWLTCEVQFVELVPAFISTPHSANVAARPMVKVGTTPGTTEFAHRNVTESTCAGAANGISIQTGSPITYFGTPSALQSRVIL